MRSVIRNLFDCIQDCASEKSKQELAKIIRRELEDDFRDAGVGNSSASTVVRAGEVDMAMDGRKLEAIKSYKNRTGLCLLDSKKAVEAAMEQRRLWTSGQQY